MKNAVKNAVEETIDFYKDFACQMNILGKITILPFCFIVFPLLVFLELCTKK